MLSIETLSLGDETDPGRVDLRPALYLEPQEESSSSLRGQAVQDGVGIGADVGMQVIEGPVTRTRFTARDRRALRESGASVAIHSVELVSAVDCVDVGWSEDIMMSGE
jgi:hypothetical protein